MNSIGIKRCSKSYNSLAVSPVQVLQDTLTAMKDLRHLNAFSHDITSNEEEALELAAQSEKRYKQGNPLSPLDGVPISFKDNFLIKNMPSTAGSKILRDFVPPIDSTMAQRCREAGAIIVGKTNMDEFGMGSFTLYSEKVPVNPINEDLVVGGSSGGAAVATATNQGMAAFGTDTGGSVTFPANCCSVYGFKPSYGRLSRHGVILYSSSNDSPGILAQNIDDISSVFQVVDGEDIKDSNSLSFTEPELRTSLKGVRVGIAEEFNIEELPQERIDEQRKVIDILQYHGAEIVEVSIPLLKQILPIYYTIIPAEAASNLSRYDGLKYGLQHSTVSSKDSKVDYQEYIQRIRTEGFGINVKRRIALGNFVLSTQDVDFNEMYIKAQKVRRLFCEQYNDIFEGIESSKGLQKGVDILLSPNAVGDIPKVSSIRSGEIDAIIGEYSQDYYTVPSNV